MLMLLHFSKYHTCEVPQKMELISKRAAIDICERVESHINDVEAILVQVNLCRP